MRGIEEGGVGVVGGLVEEGGFRDDVGVFLADVAAGEASAALFRILEEVILLAL